MKFAQLVASAPAVVGPEVADEFRGTLDRGPGVSYRQVREIYFEGTGKTIEEAFATFERKPFAAAPPEVRAYFLTWRTYGTWLPGDERGWVGRDRNGYGEPINSPDYRLENAAKGQMNQAPVELTGHQRRVIDDVLRESCEFRGWTIAALNVRTNHVHLVVGLDGEPQKAMETLKARVTRVMREHDELGSEDESGRAEAVAVCRGTTTSLNPRSTTS